MIQTPPKMDGEHILQLKELSLDEFLNQFDESVHQAIKDKLERDGVEAVVMFENPDMWSSECGHRVAVIVGPSCTFQLDKMNQQTRYGDVPSRTVWARNFARRPAQ